MYDVVSVGILVADCIAKPIRKMPDRGKLELVDKISLHTGGNAATCAINVAKLGLKSAILGKIGGDGFGDFMDGALKKQGVETSGLRVDPDATTSSSLVMVGADGERSFLHSTGANAEFVESDINYDIVSKTGHVFVTGGLLMPKFDGTECAKFLKKCKEMGKTTAYDVCWDSTGRWMELVGPSMPYIDYFMPSIEEAIELSGGLTDPDEIADKFLSMGPHTIVLKVGKKGCFVKTKKGERLEVPTYSRIKAFDTTGAGDSFCSGFLTGLSQGWSLERCAKFANAVGTHCVMAAGASTGIKPMKDILQFMEDYDKGLI
ncbi:MAG: carbohydrate kinase family protein [Clostridiaceae bacterium]|nr:carbohydrate kinase family protein [Clostridiaceae bacterium]